MKTHEKKHSNIKPFKCEHSSKSFTEKGHLKCHFNEVHLKLKKFKCEQCGRGFGRKSSLKTHQKRYLHFTENASNNSTTFIDRPNSDDNRTISEEDISFIFL